MGNLTRVLMTGAGAPGGPGIYKALTSSGKYHVVTGDANPFASGRFLSEEFHRIPSASDQRFVESLVELCKREKIDIIFPLVTAELFVFAEHADTFRAINVEVVVSSPDAIGIANDKGALLSFMRERGLRVPSFGVAKNLAELQSCAQLLGYPDVPVVIKPCVGNGSRGVRVLDANKDRFNLLFKEKPTALYSDLKQVCEIIGENEMPELVVSEFLPGTEITVDTIVADGHVHTIAMRTRDATVSGISSAGRFIENEDVVAQVRDLISVLPTLRGPIGFQFKESALGEYRILECNPRIQGTSVAAIGCGLNLPSLAIDVFLGIAAEAVATKKNVGFARYYQECFYEYQQIGRD